LAALREIKFYFLPQKRKDAKVYKIRFSANINQLFMRQISIKGNIFILTWSFLLCFSGFAQTPTMTPTPTLGIEQGFIEIETPQFTLKLLKSSQTVAALLPKGGNGFDFTPSDFLERRAANGFYHPGDLRFSVRLQGSSEWQNFSTAAARKPVIDLPAAAPDLAIADLSPTLPADCPLRVIRKWSLENGKLVLNFVLNNKTEQPLEIGALGIPLVFNNILTDRSLAEAHEKCSFSDPYIGQDAGYIQVTRLKGNGPALVVVPHGKTPFEAYQLLPEPMRPNQTFEGTFEWLARSRSLAENNWKNAKPWNAPTGETIAPNSARAFGVKFLVADEIRNIEKTLAENNRPVAVGIPGYILPNDIEAKLFLKYQSKIQEIEVEPKGALTVNSGEPTRNGWHALLIRGNDWGRARLSIKYADETVQTVHYYITKPAVSVVADLGNFLFTRQWFENSPDVFKRRPSVMSYDRETDKIVEQDNRVWIAGLGDEGGSGSWLAAGMKQFVEPKAEEIAKFERFIDGVLWGDLQYKDGANKYGVRKSLFYYAPSEFPDFNYEKSFNWTTWASWKKEQAESIGRGYNYPHVVAAYWAMYRVARNNENLVKNRPWQWYLEQAFQTTKFAFSRKADGARRVEYVDLGLMEGSIFLAVLEDLKREGLREKAAEIESLMKERADAWKREEYPFGSEMAWDSTGQEEVYAWCKYFGYDDKALVSLNSITGYMPTLPHWGYNGNARRYWDFLYGGKLRRIERQLHHYGSGLNAIPVLSFYREHPDDFYLLRVGYGGSNGALSNIDREGFASAAFHTFPDTLKWDAYSGDYGPNFFGHAFGSATYIVNHAEFGWLAFGGNIQTKGDSVKVVPLDSLRQRIYVAPLGLWLNLDAGRFSEIEINQRTNAVRVGLSPKTQNTKEARLRIEQPAKLNGIGNFRLVESLKFEREAFTIPLSSGTSRVELKAKDTK